MKQRLAFIACILMLVLPSCTRLGAYPDVVGSVVKIYCEEYPYSYEAPWQLASPSSVTGSGVIIAGNRILTSAHVVSDAKFIQVKRAGGKEKFEAEVEIVAHECDLAVLRVKDAGFFQGARPLAIGPLVALRDRVTVYGFPEGGEELSTTEGIVSRVEVRSYVHSRAWLLCGQIDAAINPGSSGGPVIRDGRIVGIAFQAGSGQNISYMVPSAVLEHFLRDIGDGKYDGIPSLEITWEDLENPSLRAKHGLKPGQSGVLVIGVRPGSPVETRMQPRDVILSVGGRSLANDGTIEFRSNERTLFVQRIQECFIGDTLPVEVLRNGRIMTVPVKLAVPINATRLVPQFQYDVQPTYFIVGGLVFQRLTANYLELFEDESRPPELESNYLYGEPTKIRKNIVVLSAVLADEVNVGYQDLMETVIIRANSRNIATMADLVEAVESNTEPFHLFVDSRGREIVLDRKRAAERDAAIRKRYKIDSDRSPDLKTKK